MKNWNSMFGKPILTPYDRHRWKSKATFVVMNKKTGNLFLMKFSTRDFQYVVKCQRLIDEGIFKGVIATLKLYFNSMEKAEKEFKILGEL